MHLLVAVQMLFHANTILLMCIGVVLGVVVGALPGFTDPMALGLAIPFTFGMQPLPALLFLLGLHFGAVYGGSITAILINTPGTPAGAAAAMDGYPLTLKGQSRKALQMSALAAFAGALISVIVLSLFAPILANVALKFSPSAYFALGLFGLSVVAGVAGKSLSKGLFAAAVGIFLSMIGTDPLVGIPVFTFGLNYLQNGINLVAALIGLFAVSEILNLFYRYKTNPQLKPAISPSTKSRLSWKDVRPSLKTMFKGGIIGSFIGALPGTGAVIASFFSYNEAVRSSKKPETYGKGNLDGIAAAESGSVGTESAAMIPLLTFGIPGDVGTAIILGAMVLHGIIVGPQLFQQSGNLVSALFLGILILEIFVLVIGWYGSMVIAKAVNLPRHYLFPLIIVLVVTGSFALENTMFTVWEMLIFGVLGFVMTRFQYPIPPLLLGLILGPIIEKNFLLAMASTGGDIAAFLFKPLTAAILILAIIFMIFSVRIHKQINRRTEAEGSN